MSMAKEIESLMERLADMTAARDTAAGAVDRFRDVVCEVLGHDQQNPGDDVLIAELRARFGKTGPEPTRWRDSCAGYKETLRQAGIEIL